MTAVAFTRTVTALQLSSPFLGPTELERRRGRPYRARLGANECLFGISPAALRVVTQHQADAALYSDPTHRSLREALAARWGLPFEHFLVGAGIEGVLELFVRAFIDPGDVAVSTRGTFAGFDYFLVGHGGRAVHAPYTAAATQDLDGLRAAAVRANAKLLYLVNPDNPTGELIPVAELRRLMDALPETCLVLLDEAYVEFAAPGNVLPATEVRPNLVRLRSFSKAYGLAGARVGYACASPRIVATLDRIRTHFAVSRLSDLMALAALEDETFLARVVADTAEGRRRYEQLARALGIHTLASSANFVAFDLGHATRAKEVADRLEQRDVFVVRPAVPPVDRLVRVTVGPTEALAYFTATLHDAITG